MRGRRLMILALCVALVGAVAAFGATAEAAKKKKKKKKKPAVVRVDQDMFLRGDVCNADARGLSVTDAEDGECWYTNAGLLYDVRSQLPAPAGTDPHQAWPARDGVPFTLDASKPVTGEITTEGGSCVLTGQPCSPVTASAGNVTFTATLVGEANGEEQTIGEFVDEFSVAPGDAHTSEIEIEPDAALDKLEFTSLTLVTRISGNSVGHGVYKLTDPSSFITLPTLVKR